MRSPFPVSWPVRSSPADGPSVSIERHGQSLTAHVAPSCRSCSPAMSPLSRGRPASARSPRSPAPERSAGWLTSTPGSAPRLPAIGFAPPPTGSPPIPSINFCSPPATPSLEGLRFGDLRRLALDIEVLTGMAMTFRARPAPTTASSPSPWSTLRVPPRPAGDLLTEAALIEECSRLIRERDPDVMEGHNIFRFDLEYLEARARRHGLTLRLGPRRRNPAGPHRPALGR